jgi:hypothetical protein
MSQKQFSLVRTILWAILTPVAYFLGWLDSVVFVSLLSLWALAESAFAAYRADANEELIKELRAVIREELEKCNTTQ